MFSANTTILDIQKPLIKTTIYVRASAKQIGEACMNHIGRARMKSERVVKLRVLDNRDVLFNRKLGSRIIAFSSEYQEFALQFQVCSHPLFLGVPP